LDAGQWDEFAACLADDFTVWETGMTAELTGRDKVLAQTRHSFETYGRWKHHVVCPVIEITSETTATGVWTVTSFDGIYEDEYVKVSGQWKVKRTRVTLSADYAAQDVRERRLKH
jgi:ketosteroid isomerase-like protein